MDKRVNNCLLAGQKFLSLMHFCAYGPFSKGREKIQKSKVKVNLFLSKWIIQGSFSTWNSLSRF